MSETHTGLSNGLDENWQRELYTQAWRQYEHENTLSLSRNTSFLTLHTAMLGIPTAVLALAGKEANDDKLLLFSLTLTVFGLMAIPLCRYWRRVTDGGQGYLKVRWAVIRALEEKVQLGRFGLATLEEEWRGKRRGEGCCEDYVALFPEIPSLSKLQIRYHEECDGWETTRRLIAAISILWTFAICVGFILLIISLKKTGLTRPEKVPIVVGLGLFALAVGRPQIALWLRRKTAAWWSRVRAGSSRVRHLIAEQNHQGVLADADAEEQVR
jgi:hypothetical protein